MKLSELVSEPKQPEQPRVQTVKLSELGGDEDDRSWLDKIGATQTAAGFLRTFGSSPQAQEELGIVGAAVPSFVWQLGALANLGSEYITGTRMPGGETATRYAQANIEAVNELLDTELPTSAIGVIQEAVGGSILPGTGPATQAMNVLTKTRPLVAQSRALSTLAPVLPATQATTGAGLAVEQALTQGISLAATAAIDPKADIVPDRVEELVDDFQFQLDNDTKVAAGVAAAGVALGGLTATYRSLRNRRAIRQLSTLEGTKQKPQELVVTAYQAEQKLNEGSTTIGTRLSAQSPLGGDSNSPIYRALRDAIDDDEVYWTLRDDITSTSSPMKLDRVVSAHTNSGQYPYSQYRQYTPAVFFRRYNALTPQQQGQLDDALVAATRIDQIDEAVRQGNPAPSFGSYSKSRLESVVNKLDLETRALFDQYHRDMARSLDFAAEGRWALLSEADRALWRVTNPHYAPLQLNFADRQSPLVVAINGLAEPNVKAFNARTLTSLTEDVQITSPTLARQAYDSALIRAKELNRMRGTILQSLHDSGHQVVHGGRRKALVRRVNRVTPNNVSRIITVMEYGKPVYYVVRDEWLANALRFTPSASLPILSAARRWQTNMSTGLLGPDFAPVAMAYDQLLAPILTRDARLRHLYAGPAGLVRYWSGVAKQVSYHHFQAALDKPRSVTRAVIGRDNTQRIARVMDKAYLRSSQFQYEYTGGGQTIHLGQTPGDQLQVALTALAPDYVKATGNFAQQLAVSGPARAYLHTLNSIHSSVRLGSFGIRKPSVELRKAVVNGERVPLLDLSIPDVRRRMQDASVNAQELAGDPSQGFGQRTTRTGTTLQSLGSIIPYASIANSAFRQLARAVYHRPVGTLASAATMATASAGLLYYSMSHAPAKDKIREHYTRDMTTSQRGRLYPIYNWNDGSVAYYVNLPHEYRLLWSPYIEALLTVSGHYGTDLLPQDIDLADNTISAIAGTLLRDIVPDYPLGAVGVRALSTLGGIRLPEYGDLAASPGVSGRFSSRQVRENPYIESATSEAMDGFLRELLMASGAMYAETARVFTLLENGDEGSNVLNNAQQAINAGMDVMLSRPNRVPTMFSDRVSDLRLQLSTPAVSYYFNAKSSIDDVASRAAQIVSPGAERRTGSAAQTAMEYRTPDGGVDDQIALYALNIKRDIERYVGQRDAELKREMRRMDANATMTQRQRVTAYNEYVRARRDLYSMAYQMIRQHELAVAKELGLEQFTFQEYADSTTRALPR